MNNSLCEAPSLTKKKKKERNTGEYIQYIIIDRFCGMNRSRTAINIFLF